MNMEEIRGRVPLNIDYSNNISGGLYNHPHKSKINYNMFDDPSFAAKVVSN